MGGIDDNGANLTSVEIISSGDDDDPAEIRMGVPDIPARMAYGGRAAANIGGTVYACAGTDTCGRPTNRCTYLPPSAPAWRDDMAPAKRARYTLEPIHFGT